jgi:hypothetical protein
VITIFWKRKPKEETVSFQSLIDSGILRELEKTIRLSTESRDKSTDKTVRAFQEMTKALNNATTELKRSKR